MACTLSAALPPQNNKDVGSHKSEPGPSSLRSVNEQMRILRDRRAAHMALTQMSSKSCKLGKSTKFFLYLWQISFVWSILLISSVKQELFPDLLCKIYMINCPTIISSIYALVRGTLAEQTRQKIVFTDREWRRTLCDDLGKENILKLWGGDKISAISPTGSIRMGGNVPKHLRYNAAFAQTLLPSS